MRPAGTNRSATVSTCMSVFASRRLALSLLLIACGCSTQQDTQSNAAPEIAEMAAANADEQLPLHEKDGAGAVRVVERAMGPRCIRPLAGDLGAALRVLLRSRQRRAVARTMANTAERPGNFSTSSAQHYRWPPLSPAPTPLHRTRHPISPRPSKAGLNGSMALFGHVSIYSSSSKAGKRIARPGSGALRRSLRPSSRADVETPAARCAVDDACPLALGILRQNSPKFAGIGLRRKASASRWLGRSTAPSRQPMLQRRRPLLDGSRHQQPRGIPLRRAPSSTPRTFLQPHRRSCRSAAGCGLGNRSMRFSRSAKRNTAHLRKFSGTAARKMRRTSLQPTSPGIFRRSNSPSPRRPQLCSFYIDQPPSPGENESHRWPVASWRALLRPLHPPVS